MRNVLTPLNVNENGNVSMTVIISPMKDGKEVYSAVLIRNIGIRSMSRWLNWGII